MRLTHSGFDVGERHDAQNDRSKVDFPRMKEGGLDAIFCNFYWPGKTNSRRK